MKLIVGLGNPGKEYEKNRHNIGFIILDKYLKEKNIFLNNNKFDSLMSKEGNNLYQKPLTFMNLSGNAIIQLVNFYKIDVKKDLLVIYDDMDIDLGKYKLKKNGSSGGHNGIKSIINNIGEDFLRLKIGISKAKYDTISHVLGNFLEEELKLIEKNEKEIFNIIENFEKNEEDIDKFISKYNPKKNNDKKDKYIFRKSKKSDIDQLIEITKDSIQSQINLKIPTWNNNYPSKETFIEDIEKNQGFVLEKNSKIIAYGAICTGIEEMYLNPINGKINHDEKYTTIHRIMVNKEYRGKNLSAEIINKLIKISYKNGYFIVRIDTNEENYPMLKIIEKLKFKHIARVIFPDKTSREVFEIKFGGN